MKILYGSIAEHPPETQEPKRPHVYTSPALVCQTCGHSLNLGDYEYAYIDARHAEGCGCGGRFCYTGIEELYERDGVYFCPTLGRYWMTRDCPTPTCWAKSCPLVEAMAAKLQTDLEADEMAVFENQEFDRWYEGQEAAQ